MKQKKDPKGRFCGKKQLFLHFLGDNTNVNLGKVKKDREYKCFNPKLLPMWKLRTIVDNPPVPPWCCLAGTGVSLGFHRSTTRVGWCMDLIDGFACFLYAILFLLYIGKEGYPIWYIGSLDNAILRSLKTGPHRPHGSHASREAGASCSRRRGLSDRRRSRGEPEIPRPRT